MEPIRAIIEIPRGSQNKYELDHETGAIMLDRHLRVSMSYPAEYGFIPDTLAGDGDPLDVVVLTEFPTFPGCHVMVKVLGVCLMTDEAGEDAKLIAVPLSDPRWKDVSDISEVPTDTLERIRHFFEVYKDLDAGKWVKIECYEGREKALAELESCRQRYQASLAH
ncbi:MAG: inorganic diphosphatase [Actinomycetota bacterium]|jgi:inorganic pyrophosphatase